MISSTIPNSVDNMFSTGDNYGMANYRSWINITAGRTTKHCCPLTSSLGGAREKVRKARKNKH